jgi:hypothetical protein
LLVEGRARDLQIYFTFMGMLIVESGFPLLLLTVNALTVTE